MKLAKTHPQRWIHDCTECDGAGRTQDVDYDDDGCAIYVNVRCEACDGSCQITSCSKCDECMPLSEAEQNGYVCGPCAAGLERGDALEEIARVRRTG